MFFNVVVANLFASRVVARVVFLRSFAFVVAASSATILAYIAASSFTLRVVATLLVASSLLVFLVFFDVIPTSLAFGAFDNFAFDFKGVGASSLTSIALLEARRLRRLPSTMLS